MEYIGQLRVCIWGGHDGATLRNAWQRSMIYSAPASTSDVRLSPPFVFFSTGLSCLRCVWYQEPEQPVCRAALVCRLGGWFCHDATTYREIPPHGPSRDVLPRPWANLWLLAMIRASGAYLLSILVSSTSVKSPSSGTTVEEVAVVLEAVATTRTCFIPLWAS
jgi:hypothetical protein